MSSKPREWPNTAREARDQAAEQAMRGLRALKPLVEQDVTLEEKYRRLAVAIDSLQMIARLLEAQGAQTRPG